MKTKLLSPRLLLMLMAGIFASPSWAQPAIDDIAFNALPGGQFEIRLNLDEAVGDDVSTYTIEEPARIIVDFPDTRSNLEQKRYNLPDGNATSVLILEAGARTRMVINMVNLSPYEVDSSGREFSVIIGQDTGGNYTRPALADSGSVSPTSATSATSASLSDLEFRRSPDGEGRLILSLSDPGIDVNVFSEGNKINVELLGANIPTLLARRYDVTVFATPVSDVEVMSTDRGGRILLSAYG